MGAGRKSIYEEKIASRFSDIDRWIKGGATERQVAAALGIAYSTFNKYKAENEEFAAHLKNIDRSEIILDLRSALLKKAMGFTYEETKKYKKTDDDGNTFTYVEITEKQSLPDVAALNLALKNYDEEWSNDPAKAKLEREKFEFDKLRAMKEDW